MPIHLGASLSACLNNVRSERVKERSESMGRLKALVDEHAAGLTAEDASQIVRGLIGLLGAEQGRENRSNSTAKTLARDALGIILAVNGQYPRIHFAGEVEALAGTLCDLVEGDGEDAIRLEALRCLNAVLEREPYRGRLLRIVGRLLDQLFPTGTPDIRLANELGHLFEQVAGLCETLDLDSCHQMLGTAKMLAGRINSLSPFTSLISGVVKLVKWLVENLEEPSLEELLEQCMQRSAKEQFTDIWCRILVEFSELIEHTMRTRIKGFLEASLGRLKSTLHPLELLEGPEPSEVSLWRAMLLFHVITPEQFVAFPVCPIISIHSLPNENLVDLLDRLETVSVERRDLLLVLALKAARCGRKECCRGPLVKAVRFLARGDASPVPAQVIEGMLQIARELADLIAMDELLPLEPQCLGRGRTFNAVLALWSHRFVDSWWTASAQRYFCLLLNGIRDYLRDLDPRARVDRCTALVPGLLEGMALTWATFHAEWSTLLAELSSMMQECGLDLCRNVYEAKYRVIIEGTQQVLWPLQLPLGTTRIPIGPGSPSFRKLLEKVAQLAAGLNACQSYLIAWKGLQSIELEAASPPLDVFILAQVQHMQPALPAAFLRDLRVLNDSQWPKLMPFPEVWSPVSTEAFAKDILEHGLWKSSVAALKAAAPVAIDCKRLFQIALKLSPLSSDMKRLLIDLADVDRQAAFKRAMEWSPHVLIGLELRSFLVLFGLSFA